MYNIINYLDKTILWAFYISLMSSFICGIWITNTFNLLGV